MPESRLVLIRHGQARCNVEQFLGGHASCTGLTDVGRDQVRALRDRLAATGELGEVHALYASALTRAQETAEILAPALGGLAVKQECELCEHHVGEADGMPWAEYRERFAFDVQAEPDREIAPGGESLNQFGERVVAALKRLVAEHAGQTVVVACHGGIIRSSMLGLLDIPTFRWFDPEHTSLTQWTHTEEGAWRLDRYNDAAHLAGFG